MPLKLPLEELQSNFSSLEASVQYCFSGPLAVPTIPAVDPGAANTQQAYQIHHLQFELGQLRRDNTELRRQNAEVERLRRENEDLRKQLEERDE